MQATVRALSARSTTAQQRKTGIATLFRKLKPLAKQARVQHGAQFFIYFSNPDGSDSHSFCSELLSDFVVGTKLAGGLTGAWHAQTSAQRMLTRCLDQQTAPENIPRDCLSLAVRMLMNLIGAGKMKFGYSSPKSAEFHAAHSWYPMPDYKDPKEHEVNELLVILKALCEHKREQHAALKLELNFVGMSLTNLAALTSFMDKAVSGLPHEAGEDTAMKEPTASGMAAVDGVQCLGAQATDNDVRECLARSSNKIKTGSAQISGVSVPLWKLYNAVQAGGGWSEVSNGDKLQAICNDLGIPASKKGWKGAPVAAYNKYLLPISAEFLRNPSNYKQPETTERHTYDEVSTMEPLQLTTILQQWGSSIGKRLQVQRAGGPEGSGCLQGSLADLLQMAMVKETPESAATSEWSAHIDAYVQQLSAAHSTMPPGNLKKNLKAALKSFNLSAFLKWVGALDGVEGPGAAQVGPRAAQLGPGAAQVGPGAAQLRPGAAQVGPGAAQLGPGAAQVGPGAAQVGPGAAQLGPGAAQLGPGAAQLGPGAAQLGPGAAQVGPGAAQVGPGAAQVGHGAAQVGPGAAQMGHGAAQVGHGAAQLGPGAAQVGHGAAQLGPGAAQVVHYAATMMRTSRHDLITLASRFLGWSEERLAIELCKQNGVYVVYTHLDQAISLAAAANGVMRA